MKLDRIDKRILAEMQANGRISNLELADKVGLSPTPCSRRVKQLEESGVIDRHVTLLNQAALGLNITAMIGITMDRHTPERFATFEREVRDFPEVIECSIVTGQAADYLLKAVLPDMTYYEEFLLGRLTRIEGVTGVHSSFVLRRVIAKTELPLEHIDHIRRPERATPRVRRRARAKPRRQAGWSGYFRQFVSMGHHGMRWFRFPLPPADQGPARASRFRSSTYQASTFSRAHGVRRRNLRLDLTEGSLKKQRIGMRRHISAQPCRATRVVSTASRVMPCSGSRDRRGSSVMGRRRTQAAW